jgi:hypothetical protein
MHGQSISNSYAISGTPSKQTPGEAILAAIRLRRPVTATGTLVLSVCARHRRSVIAARPENPDRLRPAPHRPALPEGAQTGASSAEDRTQRLPPFRPLDVGIVSEAIPAFFIGRNKDGFWVARNANGKIGGNFPI